MNIGIVENDSLFRETMVERLAKINNVESVQSWNSAEEFLQDSERSEISIIFIDIGLPGMSGIDLSGILFTRQPKLSRVIVTTIGTDEVIFQALRNGCVGYLLKSEIGNLESIVETVANGGGIISPTIAVRVMESFQPDDTKELELLTDREQQILNLLTEGHKIIRIADILKLSAHTIRQHVKNIYRKLHINNRSALIKKAHDLGIF